MIEQGWSKVGILCPDCKQQVKLDEAAVSADSEFRFSGLCPKCKERVIWRVFAGQLIHQALCNDIARCHTSPVIPVSRRLTPPLAIPPEKISDDDRKLLEEFGICPDDPADKVPPQKTVDDIIRDVDKGFPPLGGKA